MFVCQAENTATKDVLSCDVIILGSPAMGDEELDESMEDFFLPYKPIFPGKRLVCMAPTIEVMVNGCVRGKIAFVLPARN